jgi:hypothetical protein
LNGEHKTSTVSDLLELKKHEMLKANPEYQRGLVWSNDQKKKLIDSILRGYPIPLIYLHRISHKIGGLESNVLNIIDGQQRINALYEFCEGAFKLYDPVADEDKARFPYYIQQQPCPWKSKFFHEFSEDDQKKFLATELSIVYINADNEHEARDLFIRLQAGTPLSNQDKRDAWPGNINDLILRTAGKPEIAKYPGHEFFTRVMGVKPSGNRSKFRQFCAQWALLYWHRKRGNDIARCDTNAAALDTFYHRNIDLDTDGEEAKRFTQILDKLTTLLGDGKRKPLKHHEALHLILLVDSLWDDYTRSWEDGLAAAFDEFMHNYVLAKGRRYQPDPGKYWTVYGQGTRVGSDRGDSIARRHEFFVSEMTELLPSLTMKDQQRGFGAVERELIYHRDAKRCAVCEATVAWNEAEVHHVDPHAKGGRTNLENGALVHAHCHPKSQSDVEEFRQMWLERKKASIATVTAQEYSEQEPTEH